MPGMQSKKKSTAWIRSVCNDHHDSWFTTIERGEKKTANTLSNNNDDFYLFYTGSLARNRTSIHGIACIALWNVWFVHVTRHWAGENHHWMRRKKKIEKEILTEPTKQPTIVWNIIIFYFINMWVIGKNSY